MRISQLNHCSYVIIHAQHCLGSWWNRYSNNGQQHLALGFKITYSTGKSTTDKAGKTHNRLWILPALSLCFFLCFSLSYIVLFPVLFIIIDWLNSYCFCDLCVFTLLVASIKFYKDDACISSFNNIFIYMHRGMQLFLSGSVKSGSLWEFTHCKLPGKIKLRSM